MKNTFYPYQFAGDGLSLHSEDLCQLLIEGNPDPVLAIDAECRVVLLNKASEQWLGTKRSEALGQHLLHLLHHDNREELVTALFDSMRDGLNRGSHTAANGHHYSWQLLPMTDREGKMHGVLCMVQDRSQHQQDRLRMEVLQAQVEEKDFLLRNRARMTETIIDTSRDLIVVLDREFRICAVNKACQAYWDKSIDEVTGKALLSVFPQLEGSRVAAALEAARAGHPMYLAKEPCTVRNGTCSITVSPLRHEQTVYGLLILAELNETVLN